ncbi:DEKNAAC104468 [Brettanomyces naardenensis]|uniref:Glutamate--tRNA ligase, mitochondrial n=1 Tax=Brettanomyces naardenensis TaxID=13370 RepID=A0A448YRI6_BRENA|nr:DEKNAAC104468 [Brettanomyces naardenensis]
MIQRRSFHTVLGGKLLTAHHHYAKFSLRDNSSHESGNQENADTLTQPTEPVRARFAPSPTGFLHLGSLRTALYNYLTARSTHGQFLLRLEDTDQKRLVKGAEENIYETLKWLGMNIDEGPIQGGPYAPYRQSDRSSIYAKYAQQLLNKGLAYRCFCSKDRLDQLRDSARRLKPPTTASYDRYCMNHYSVEESDRKAADGEEFTVRFVSPDRYPVFSDLLHGEVDQQIQVNPTDRRYEDPVLLKSDGLPTYHFANVVDDHLMKITHVIRGEEWLASTPKHVALYNAFGWTPPKFIHIPLLTTVDNRKLSKRSGDIDIMSLKSKGYLPEALVNFSVLFGWSPKRDYGKKYSEVLTLKELEEAFTLEGLTKGNAKVDFSKLEFFNKHYLGLRLADSDSQFYEDTLRDMHNGISKSLSLPNLSIGETDRVLKAVSSALNNVNELNTEKYWYFFVKPKYSMDTLEDCTKQDIVTVGLIVKQLKGHVDGLSPDKLSDTIKEITKTIPSIKRKTIYQALRYALSGPQSGTSMHTIIDILGMTETQQRIQDLEKFIDEQAK